MKMKRFLATHRVRASVLAVSFLLAVIVSACSTGNAMTPPHGSSCSTIPFSSASTHGVSNSLVSIPVPGHPFASVVTNDGQWVFVSLDNSNAASSGIAVFQRQGVKICLMRVLALPTVPLGLALTHDNSLLLVADYTGVAFVDVARAKVGTQNVVLGSIQEGSNPMAKEAIEVLSSRDDHYAFVANENDGTVGVFDLQRIRQHKFGSGTILGQIQVNEGPLYENSGPVGMAVSPDNRYLYVTSRIDTGDPSLKGNICNGFAQGALSVVDITRLTHASSHAVLAHAFAGCGPVRVELSSSGALAWVTAQGSNMVLAFDTSRLLSNPTHALLASVPVEKGPTGMALVDNDAEMVVTNSNRVNNTNAQSATNNPLAPSTITILDTKNALVGRPALLGTIRVGSFPRELTLAPGGQILFLTNYNSNVLSIINVKALPQPSKS